MIAVRTVTPQRVEDAVFQLRGYSTPLLDKLVGLEPKDAHCFIMSLDTPYRLMGVAGVIPDNTCAGTAFTVLTTSFDLSPFVHQLIRIHREQMGVAFDKLDLRRIHSMTPTWDYQSIKWMELLGFKGEAILKQTLPDGDDAMVLYQLRSENEYGMGRSSERRVGHGGHQLIPRDAGEQAKQEIH